MRNMIKELDKKYDELKHQLNIKKANGSLSKFDEAFGIFFNNMQLRIEFGDENFELSNNEMLERLDNATIKEYILFYKEYLAEIEEEMK